MFWTLHAHLGHMLGKLGHLAAVMGEEVIHHNPETNVGRMTAEIFQTSCKDPGDLQSLGYKRRRGDCRQFDERPRLLLHRRKMMNWPNQGYSRGPADPGGGGELQCLANSTRHERARSSQIVGGNSRSPLFPRCGGHRRGNSPT